ncbi:MAG: protein kinase [Lachnospiraceae bacterium]
MNLQGTYTEIEEIGAGGGGTVFRAFHVRMQKYVVLKKIHVSLQDNVDIRGELDILKNLRHSYLPTVLDFIEDEGAIYTVMDYIPGESFESLLKKGVRFSQAQVIKYASQLGDVLSYLHGQKTPIVHGDIKPANIMLTPEDNICLIDFDISQIKNNISTTNMGYTPGFAPPEQVALVRDLENFLAANGNMGAAPQSMPAQAGGGTGTVMLNRQPEQPTQAVGGTGTVMLNHQPEQPAQAVGGTGTVMLNHQPAQPTQAGGGTGTVMLNHQPEQPAQAGGGTGTVMLNHQPNQPAAPAAQVSAPIPMQAPSMPANLQGRMDERSDIYSAGATLYALLCGTIPDGDFSKIVPLEQMGNFSEGLINLIQKCMAYQPEKRWQSAAEFVRATANITKADKRYKRLLHRQEFTIVLCILGIAAGIIVAILGKERIGVEHREAYDELVAQMEELVEEGNYAETDELEGLYIEAITAFPELAGAYYEKAVFLYQGRFYEELIDFLEEDVLSPGKSFSGEETGNFYFLLANCYLELDEIDEALLYYKTAVGYNVLDGTFYSDYAIALARDGQLEKAEEILEQAIGYGLADDKMLLAKGEILGKQGNIEEAATCFAECIEKTSDAYVMARAYIMWAKLYDADPESAEMFAQKASILEEANHKVAAEYQAMILEQLAQAYIDLAGVTADQSVYRQAIDCLQEIVELGWDTYVTHTNIGILYETIDELALAEEEFLGMLDTYGEDYRTYKRLAFLEINIQGTKENQDRDYSTFLEYYHNAKELFESSGARADSDMEMQLLEQTYGQLRDGNWISE